MLFKRIRLRKYKKMKSHRINASRAFTDLPSFQIVTIIFSFLALTSTYLIVKNTPLYWDFSSNGFNTFIETFRFPLGVLAAYIPILGIIGINHRSVQTLKQIELAANQNNFSNYYKHLEEFEKYWGEVLNRKKTPQLRFIHLNMFPLAKMGKYEPVTLRELGANQQLVNGFEIILQIIRNDEEETEKLKPLFLNVIELFADTINIVNKATLQKMTAVEDQMKADVLVSPNKYDAIIKILYKVITFLKLFDDICKFGTFQVYPFVDELRELVEKSKPLISVKPSEIEVLKKGLFEMQLKLELA
ncbi:hypothetical protein V4U24_001146 [Vibrio parahaemolyticus]|nr:hypothetical protein [Vibrio parahaemolyticus]ELM4064190.1 hypothetical protein [Vibrio parahaemolyticus]